MYVLPVFTPPLELMNAGNARGSFFVCFGSLGEGVYIGKGSDADMSPDSLLAKVVTIYRISSTVILSWHPAQAVQVA